MTNTEQSPATLMRGRIKADLLAAMKARQGETAAILRIVMAAIDNAEAVALPAAQPVDHALFAALSTQRDDGPRPAALVLNNDVPRRVLTREDIRAIIEREAGECQAAAAEYERAGRPDEAGHMRAAAAVIAAYLEEDDQ